MTYLHKATEEKAKYHGVKDMKEWEEELLDLMED